MLSTNQEIVFRVPCPCRDVSCEAVGQSRGVSRIPVFSFSFSHFSIFHLSSFSFPNSFIFHFSHFTEGQV